MHSLADQLQVYKRYHTQPITKITHYVGIPALLLATLMFLNWFSIHFAVRWHISFAWLFTIGLLIYYFALNIRLALLMTVILFIITWFASWLATPGPTKTSFLIFLVLLIIGAIAQTFGHFFEKNKPDFLKSLFNLLLMPLFITIDVLNHFGFNQYFNI